MPEGGTLTLRTGSTTDSRDHEGRVFIEVTDNGIGMDEETRSRCLEPFFTTKGERGTGLGLAMVYGIAERHGMSIDIRSAPGGGTTFRLTFPDRPPPAPAVAPVAQLRPRRTRILLIDDDPLLLTSLRDVLASEGHQVETAPGGQQGIDTFVAAHESGRGFPVVFTDLGMPHIDGRAVAVAIARVAPATPIFLLTGWGQRLAEAGDTPPHIRAVLSKPPRLNDLRQKLAEVTGHD